MMKHGAIASFLAAFTGSVVLVIFSSFIYGRASILFAFVMLPVSFIVAFSLAIPLMKLRKHIEEPYYFLVYLLLGFVGGVIAVNVTFQKTIIAPWVIFTYGPLGAICAVTAWYYLKRNYEKWYKNT